MRLAYVRFMGGCLLAAAGLACSADGGGLKDTPTSPVRADGATRADGPATADGPPAGPDQAPPIDPEPAGCNPGYHACGTSCVDNKSPASCGSSCEPCPAPSGGNATCDGVKCGVTCPTGQKPCLTACVPDNAACDSKCPAGQNACGGICVDAKNLAACGPACLPCPGSPNGTSSCDGQACALTCKAGFHRCGEMCKGDSDATGCGTACVFCPAPPGGRATCSAGACGFECNVGRKCGSMCFADAQPCNGSCGAGFRNCDGTCTAQSALPAETCDGKDNDCDGAVDEDIAPRACTPACAGQQRCVGGRWDSAGCANTTSDARACGTSCRVCSAGTAGTPVCRAGVCAVECRDPKLPVPCGTGCCQCASHAQCPPNNVCTPQNTCVFQAPVVTVVHGHYGKNCPGNTMFDKTADLAGTCNGKTSCPYTIDWMHIGDPAVGCAKEYEAAWRCVSGATVSPIKTVTAPAEAGFGSVITLVCP
jgi:hypothetical protein